MTREEIEAYRHRLQALVEKWHPAEDPELGDVTKGDFQRLAREVGASTRAVYINPKTGGPAGYPALIDDLVSNIHQALQTASMIGACRTAAENARRTAENVQLTRDTLEETRKAQRTAKMAAGAALLGAIATPIIAVATVVTVCSAG